MAFLYFTKVHLIYNALTLRLTSYMKPERKKVDIDKSIFLKAYLLANDVEVFEVDFANKNLCY